MKRIKLLVVGGIVMVASGAFAQTAPGSFVNHHVSNTSQLIAHAQNDRRVMNRYMRHFDMSETEVVEFLSHLRMTTTNEDNIYVVYGAPNGGPVRNRLLKVKKGTRVFVDETGEVVLIGHCGNPVTRGPKVALDASKPVANTTGTPMEELRDVPLQAPVATMEASIPAMAEPGVPSIPTIPTTNEGDIPIVTSPIPIPGVLGILPILGLVTNTGGSNSNPPVPEPATMAALGIGVAAIVSRRRKRK